MACLRSGLNPNQEARALGHYRLGPSAIASSSVIVFGRELQRRRLEILSLAQSDVSRYVAAMSEQPGQLALKHQCGHERSWNRLEGLSTENE
jgi:hypothetical protein